MVGSDWVRWGTWDTQKYPTMYFFFFLIGLGCYNIYIYIYIYRREREREGEREREREMSLSYTWCNSYKVIHFLHRRIIRNLTAKKMSLNAITFNLIRN